MSRTSPRLIPRLLLAATAALTLLAGCSAGGAGEASPPSPDAVETSTTATTPPDTTEPDSLANEPAPAASTILVARPSGDVAVSPTPGAPATATLTAATEFGSARALVVIDQQSDWLQVSLPERPNGSTGWIPAAGVELREVSLAIEVDLAARTLRLTDAGTTVLETPVAIGADATPTPTGTFYVTDKLATGTDTSAYGPFAFGLSAHSDTLSEFGGGDGQVGIHGTSDPNSIGQAVSHGCIRVPNDVARTLNDLLPLGVPVTVR